jgi:ankyrin repeat protein
MRVPAQNFTLHSLVGYISCIKDLELVLERLGDDVSSLQNRDAAGRTPLLLSCMSGNYPAMKLFLGRGADTSVQSDIGQGVLHFLQVFDPSEQYDIAAEAMRGGADPNALISAGEDLSLLPRTPATTVLYVANGAPLHHAILHNDLAAVKILLSHGANCLIENSEFVSALGLSASLHCSEILDHLLETNDVDVAKWYDHYGNNLVHAALDDKWDELRMFVHISDYFTQAEKTLSVLRQKGADWEKLSQAWQIPAPHFATLKSSVNILSLLLKSGLKYQIDMPSSISLPLHTAIKRGDEHKSILLLENGANVHLQAEGTGDSCLHLCIKTAFEDAFFVETLVKYNAEVDAVNHAGETPFCLAVARKQFKTATLLLKLGADVNHVDYEVRRTRSP